MAVVWASSALRPDVGALLTVRGFPWGRARSWVEDFVRTALMEGGIQPLHVEAVSRPGGVRTLANGGVQLHTGTVLLRVAEDDVADTKRILDQKVVDGRSLALERCRNMARTALRPMAPPLVAEQRRERGQRRRQRTREEVDRLLDVVEGASWPPALAHEPGPAPALAVDWGTLPPSCDPCSTRRMQSTPRGLRKRETVAAVAVVLSTWLASTRGVPTVVDFGCGTGNVLLPLAALAGPGVRFVGVDVKAESLRLLEERASAAGLQGQVATWRGAIADYAGPLDLVVSVHACGRASDDAILAGVAARAPFAVSPCCVGKGAGEPSSAWLAGVLDKATDDVSSAYRQLAGWADHSPVAGDDAGRGRQLRAKHLLETDRLALAVEAGYSGAVTRLQGEAMTLSRQRELILGWPPDAAALTPNT